MDNYNDDKTDALASLFLDSNSPDNIDNSEEFDQNIISVDLNKVNTESQKQAVSIVDKLSGYYFDDKYLKEHPYIPSKIAQCTDNIRRLLKMLSVNEQAQDTLIVSIGFNASKGAMYQSLTSLQNSMLSIQNQLNDYVNSLEDIFRKMQEECQLTFEEKTKETEEDGSVVVRGSRDFIKSITAMIEESNDKIEKIG